MNIYHIIWSDYKSAIGEAVVIAPSVGGALAEVNIDEQYKYGIAILILGSCIAKEELTRTVCRTTY